MRRDGKLNCGVQAPSRVGEKSPASKAAPVFGRSTSYFEKAYCSRTSLIMREPFTQVWPTTVELTGLPKSKLFDGWIEPPADTIGRYSISWAARTNSDCALLI